MWNSREINGAMETVEYMWVDIWCMLHWIKRLCHKTAEMHFAGMSFSTSGYTEWSAVVAESDEICENLNPLQGLTVEVSAWWNEDLCTQSRTENGYWRDCEIIKILCFMLGTTRTRAGDSVAGAKRHNYHGTHYGCVRNYCYLLYTIQAENAVTLSSKVSDKNGRQKQTKSRWEWSGRDNKNGMECGKCKGWEKVLWWGENFPRLLLGIMDMRPAGLIVTGDWGVQAPWGLWPFKL